MYIYFNLNTVYSFVLPYSFYSRFTYVLKHCWNIIIIRSPHFLFPVILNLMMEQKQISLIYYLALLAFECRKALMHQNHINFVILRLSKVHSVFILQEGDMGEMQMVEAVTSMKLCWRNQGRWQTLKWEVLIQSLHFSTQV